MGRAGREGAQHRDLYYNGQPVITDGEFDELFRRLQKLEEDHPELAVPDSPTKEVGAPAADTVFADVTHPERMMSLDNVFNEDEMREWLAKAPGPYPVSYTHLTLPTNREG